jgi:hypothetical protein
MSLDEIKRVDRGPYVVPVWFGLLFTGIKTLVVPHTPENLVYFHDAAYPELFEWVLAVLFIVACVACLVASAMGTPWFSPSTPLLTVYKIEFIGLAAIVVILAVDAVANTIPLFQLFTLGGGFGGIIQIGSLAMMGRLWVGIDRRQSPPAA